MCVCGGGGGGVAHRVLVAHGLFYFKSDHSRVRTFTLYFTTCMPTPTNADAEDHPLPATSLIDYHLYSPLPCNLLFGHHEI